MAEFADRYVLGFIGKLVPSLLWLLYRCYQVLSTPVDELVQELRIDIPYTPTVCVDSVSQTLVVLHWDIQIKRDESLYFLLVVNGIEAARLTGTSCKIDSLLPGKLYRINIIAVNSLTNFRSQLRPSFIETIELQNTQLARVLEECDVTEDIEKLTEASNASAGMAADASELARNLPADIAVAEVSKCTDVHVLHYYLHKYQQELIKTNNETKAFEEKSRIEIQALRDEEKRFKIELDTESDNRAKKDNDVKSYEHKKSDLAFMKSKLTANVRHLESADEIIKSRIAGLRSEKERKRKRNNLALESKDGEIASKNEKINELKANNAHVRKENEEIENTVKSLKSKRKELTRLLDQLKPVVDAFHIEFNANREGTILRNAIDLLLEINRIAGPEWEREINNEVNTYVQLEMDWKSTFRFEIRKYISLQHSFEIAKQNKDKSYQPQKLSEYQASIEFGGYQNALVNRSQNQYSSSSLVNLTQGTSSAPTSASGKFKRNHNNNNNNGSSSNNHYYSREPSAPYSSNSSNSNIPTPEYMSNVSSSASQMQQPQALGSSLQSSRGVLPVGLSSGSAQPNTVALDSSYTINALAKAAANDVNMSASGYNDFDFYFTGNNDSNNEVSIATAQNQNSTQPQIYNNVTPGATGTENRFNFASHYQDIYYGDNAQNTAGGVGAVNSPNNQVMSVPMVQNTTQSLDYLLTNNPNNMMFNFDDSNGSFNFEGNASGSGAASLSGIAPPDTSDHLINSPLTDIMQLTNGATANSTLLPTVAPNGGNGGITSNTPLLGMNSFNGRIGTLNVGPPSSGNGSGSTNYNNATALAGSASTNSINPVSSFNTAGSTYASPFWNNSQVGSTTAQAANAYNLRNYSNSPDFLANFNDLLVDSTTTHQQSSLANPFGRNLNTLSPAPIITNNLVLAGGPSQGNNGLMEASINGLTNTAVVTPSLPSTGIFLNTTPGSGTIHSSGGGGETISSQPKLNDALEDTDSIHSGTGTTASGLSGNHGGVSGNGGLLWDYGLGYHRRNVSNGPIWRNDNLSTNSFTMSGGPSGGPGTGTNSVIGTRSRSNTFNAPSGNEPDLLLNRPSPSTLF